MALVAFAKDRTAAASSELVELESPSFGRRSRTQAANFPCRTARGRILAVGANALEHMRRLRLEDRVEFSSDRPVPVSNGRAESPV